MQKCTMKLKTENGTFYLVDSKDKYKRTWIAEDYFENHKKEIMQHFYNKPSDVRGRYTKVKKKMPEINDKNVTLVMIED